MIILTSEIIPFDLQRMFFGTEQALFYLEILVRTGIIYLYTLILVRWVGSRSLSQLSIVEFLLVVALGSAVGDPLFYPEVPLFHAMLAITGIVLINKAIDWILMRSNSAQRALDGIPRELIRDGHLNIAQAQARNIAPAEVYEQLRLKGVRNLGELEMAYIEPNGEISLFRRPVPVAGLPIVPPPEMCEGLCVSRSGPGLCCNVCGHMTGEPVGPCPGCGRSSWRRAECRPASLAEF